MCGKYKTVRNSAQAGSWTQRAYVLIAFECHEAFLGSAEVPIGNQADRGTDKLGGAGVGTRVTIGT